MAASALAVMSPDGGLSRYLSEIRKFPMLAKDEEFRRSGRKPLAADLPAAKTAWIALHRNLVGQAYYDHRSAAFGEAFSLPVDS